MSEEWKSRAQKPADFCWGTCLGISRGVPEVWARLAYVSFLPHDLVTGGIPHTGFQQISFSSPCCRRFELPWIHWGWTLAKEESEKIGLKLNIQKTKIIASDPITSWEINGETVETGSDFILGGSKITADGDCSHEIKRRLLLVRKVTTNLDSILKRRDITLPTKCPSSQGYGFSNGHVWMWELDCEEYWAWQECFSPKTPLMAL